MVYNKLLLISQSNMHSKQHHYINFRPHLIEILGYFIPQKYYCCVEQRFKQNNFYILQILQIFQVEMFKSSSIVGKNSGIATTHRRVDIPPGQSSLYRIFCWRPSILFIMVLLTHFLAIKWSTKYNSKSV